jgi:hypothetical protein
MIQYSSLASALAGSVVELKFSRRRPKQNISTVRRMLCTLDFNLLNSEKGLKVLNFNPPKSSSTYNTQNKGLIVVWDILKQDWRTVNTESCQIISTIPTVPPDSFWEYFESTIVLMSPSQKAAFIAA